MGSPFGPLGPDSQTRTDVHHDEYDPAGPLDPSRTSPDRITRPEGAVVVGVAEVDKQIGVYGFSPGNVGVMGKSGTGIGVYGQGAQAAGVFQGDVQVTGSGSFTGDLEVGGDVRLINADLAEDFTIAEAEPVDPGTVMVLGEGGTIQRSRRAYDTRVVGVISGAGGYKPGIVLDRQTQGGRQPVALMGKVYCKVDARYGAIETGHLLTTSPTPGHAMRAGDALQAFGACIGKALSPLASGQGLIPILVTLQ
jgi:hypothetical protein